jgi:hypothetical protein
MSLLGDVETFYDDGAWRNRVEGSGTTAIAFPTQAAAVEVGRQEAKQTGAHHRIRDEAGRIVEEMSYTSEIPRDTAG